MSKDVSAIPGWNPLDDESLSDDSKTNLTVEIHKSAPATLRFFVAIPLVIAISFLLFLLLFISQGGHKQINLEYASSTMDDKGGEASDDISDSNEGS